MAVLCDIFYVVLFITLAGSAFTLLVLLLERVFGIMLPLWAGILGMALYIVPIFSPGLFLISPEEQVWLEGYRIACAVWGCGAVLFALYGVLKIGLAHRAAGEWQVCREEGINAFCAECAAIAGLKRVPRIYFGTLEDPACVMGVLCPKIILNRRVAAKLTRAQLAVVLGHEVMHIRRAHMVGGRQQRGWQCFKRFGVFAEQKAHRISDTRTVPDKQHSFRGGPDSCRRRRCLLFRQGKQGVFLSLSRLWQGYRTLLPGFRGYRHPGRAVLDYLIPAGIKYNQ